MDYITIQLQRLIAGQNLSYMCPGSSSVTLHRAHSHNGDAYLFLTRQLGDKRHGEEESSEVRSRSQQD